LGLGNWDLGIETVRLTFALFGAASLLMLAAPAAMTRQAGQRTVYVAAVDRKHVPVTDLTAADFVVKEDGKVRTVTKAEVATAPLKIALLLDDGGLGLGGIRQGAGQFIETLQGKGEFAIITVGGRKLTLLDFTANVPALYAGLKNLLARNTTSTDLLDGFIDVAAEFQRRETERPVMVTIASEGEEVSSARAPVVLEAIQKSRAKFYYIGLGVPVTQGTRGGLAESSNSAEAGNRNAVLGAAPKNSGGRSEQVLQPSGVPVLMKQFADELAAQYAVTYATDAREARFNIETTRKGVTVRGPSRVGSR
jgi:VWFA-related protein